MLSSYVFRNRETNEIIEDEKDALKLGPSIVKYVRRNQFVEDKASAFLSELSMINAYLDYMEDKTKQERKTGRGADISMVVKFMKGILHYWDVAQKICEDEVTNDQYIVADETFILYLMFNTEYRIRKVVKKSRCVEKMGAMYKHIDFTKPPIVPVNIPEGYPRFQLKLMASYKLNPTICYKFNQIVSSIFNRIDAEAYFL